jgi:predicted TIM-barrel fold metal-dependent hydrolase
MNVTRRQFLGTVAAGAGVSTLKAQIPAASPWNSPVLDAHLHIRRDLEANVAHMDGCGVSHAVILARDTSASQLRAAQANYPGRLVWAAATDISTPGAEARLTQAVKDGALGFGEMKFHLDADGPEFRRMYALAADLNVPILIHFQEVPHFEGEGVFATGFKRFEAMLKAYPKTRVIGHADAFWANVDAAYADEAAYPTGPITRAGITDRLLADYPNLFGDLSANSGNNALSRDSGFTAGFLQRHQDKLMFGSDCSCVDGKGMGIGQANNPAASRLAGKCVARETLTLLQQSASPAVFRKLTWENAHRIFAIRG